MSDNLFSGKWVGKYTYGEGYPKRLKGESWTFTIIMEVAEDGKMTGKCFDDGGSIQMEAVIDGTINNGSIEFLKKYLQSWKSDAEGKPVLNKDKAPQEITYFGKFQDEAFSGAWKVISRYKRWFGGYRELVGRGSWVMRRE